MTTFDPAWAAAQVAGKYPEGHPMGQALNWLIECWVSVESSQVDLELLTAEFRLLLDHVALHPLPVEQRSAPIKQRIWAPGSQWAEPGRVGRVRPDLLVRDGWKLNGRVGDIVGVRRGDVILVFHRGVRDGPPEYRGPASHFEVDISNINIT
jgi:hypothetical protein